MKDKQGVNIPTLSFLFWRDWNEFFHGIRNNLDRALSASTLLVFGSPFQACTGHGAGCDKHVASSEFCPLFGSGYPVNSTARLCAKYTLLT